MEPVKRKRAVVRGSFTVEAAFVMPIVILVIFMLIKTGFLVYGEAVSGAEKLRIFEKREMAVRHIGDVETGRPDYERLFEKPELSSEDRKWASFLTNPAEYKRRRDN